MTEDTRTVTRASLAAALREPATLPGYEKWRGNLREAVSWFYDGWVLSDEEAADAILAALPATPEVRHPRGRETGSAERSLTCWTCRGRTWMEDGDVQDGMMSGRTTCWTCLGTGSVTPDELNAAIARMIEDSTTGPGETLRAAATKTIDAANAVLFASRNVRQTREMDEALAMLDGSADELGHALGFRAALNHFKDEEKPGA